MPEDRPIGEYYVDAIRINSSPMTFAFLMGRAPIPEYDEIKETGLILQAVVSMSPQHAKAFSGLLSELVRRYELENGPLPDYPLEVNQESVKGPEVETNEGE